MHLCFFLGSAPACRTLASLTASRSATPPHGHLSDLGLLKLTDATLGLPNKTFSQIWNVERTGPKAAKERSVSSSHKSPKPSIAVLKDTSEFTRSCRAPRYTTPGDLYPTTASSKLSVCDPRGGRPKTRSPQYRIPTIAYVLGDLRQLWLFWQGTGGFNSGKLERPLHDPGYGITNAEYNVDRRHRGRLPLKMDRLPLRMIVIAASTRLRYPVRGYRHA
jgi:hypothetical protein